MTDDDLEFQQNWSRKSGEVAGLRKAMDLAWECVASNYRSGNDAVAMHIRHVARQIDELHKLADAELLAFVKEAEKRRAKP